MIFFSVISGTPERVQGAYQDTVAGIAREAGFTDGKLRSHLSSDRHWAVVTYGAPDPLAGQRLVMSPAGCVIVNGPLTEFDGARGDEAISRLSNALQAESIDAVYRRMSGSFAVGGYLRQHGHFGFSDFSGLTPNYWARRDGLTVIGNKPGIVALGLGESVPDMRALSWLIGHANIFGTATPLAGVHQIEPETLIRARRGLSPRMTLLPTVWPDRDAVLTGNVADAEWDEITHHLIENTRAALACSDTAKLGLTGGKDSRLVLALASAVRDKSGIETFTNGHADNPDVETATHVARHFGVRHAMIAPKSGPAAPSAAFWPKLAAHCARFDSLICPWDGLTGNLNGTQMVFTGFGGELFRGSHVVALKKNPPNSVQEAQATWNSNYHQPFDPLKLLRPGHIAHQRAWLDDWIADNPSHLTVLPEKFYVFNRLGHSTGPLMQFVPGRIKLSPLLSRQAARQFFRFSREIRIAEMLNYQVIRRLAPELNAIPYMKQVWSPLVLALDPDLPDKPFPNTQAVSAASVAPAQYRFLADEAENITAFLRQANRETAIDGIFDVGGAVAALQSGEALKSTVNAKTIFSCLAIAFRLLGKGVPPQDRLL